MHKHNFGLTAVVTVNIRSKLTLFGFQTMYLCKLSSEKAEFTNFKDDVLEMR